MSSSITFFVKPIPTTCVGIQLAPTKTIRKFLASPSTPTNETKNFARAGARNLLAEMKSKITPGNVHQNYNSAAASISHEADGSAAAILHYYSNKNSADRNPIINGVGVDIVLPSRIQQQCRRNWGTHDFSRRWLGVENVRTVEREIRRSHRDHHQGDPRTLACALLWGWRESTTKALSEFKYLEKRKNVNNGTTSPPSSAAPTFSIQNTRVGSISSSLTRHEGVTLIRMGEMVRCSGARLDEETARRKDQFQWDECLARGGTSMNRMNSDRVTMGAIIYDPGLIEQVGESVVVCFTIIS